jgi:hypothetical protein
MDLENPQKKEGTDGIYSEGSTAYMIKGGSVRLMITQGTLISNMYKTQGMTNFATVFVRAFLIDEKPSSGKKYLCLFMTCYIRSWTKVVLQVC